MLLRAVEQRHRVQLDVAGGHAAIDDAARVLRDQRAVRQHGALRPRLGAGRVEDLGRVVRRDLDRRLRRVRMLEQRRKRLPAIALAVQHHAHSHALAHVGRQPVLHEQRHAARMAQHVAGLAAGEHEVDGNEHCARAGDAEDRLDVADGVAGEDGDAVTLDNAPLA